MVTVLIVEASLTDSNIMSLYLENAGFNFSIARSAEEARADIASQRPDAIITDVILPGQNGLEFCRDLKQDPQTQSIPVIVCSTKSTEIDKLWAMKQGANAYLVKPVNQNELIQNVTQLTAK